MHFGCRYMRILRYVVYRTFLKESHSPVGGVPFRHRVLPSTSVSGVLRCCMCNSVRNWTVGHHGRSRIYLNPILCYTYTTCMCYRFFHHTFTIHIYHRDHAFLALVIVTAFQKQAFLHVIFQTICAFECIQNNSIY